jgi:hypothetical protein
LAFGTRIAMSRNMRPPLRFLLALVLVAGCTGSALPLPSPNSNNNGQMIDLGGGQPMSCGAVFSLTVADSDGGVDDCYSLCTIAGNNMQFAASVSDCGPATPGDLASSPGILCNFIVLCGGD